MTRVARVERASRTNTGAGRTAGRLGRRVRSDPHVLLALALAVPTVLVNLLDHGPNEAALTILALTFVSVQAVLTARTRTHGRPTSGHLEFDPWQLARLTLAVVFVAAASYATADEMTFPLAALYIPVIGMAAAFGSREAIATLVLSSLGFVAPLIGDPVRAASGAEPGLVLAAVGIVLAIGTRQTVSSLEVTLDRLRSKNASERRRNRQSAGIEAVGRTLAADGPDPGSLEAVMELLTGSFGYSHGSIYLGEELGGSPTQLRMGAQRGYDRPIAVFDGTAGVIGRVIRTRQPALVPDVHVDPDYVGAATGLRSEVCAPLMAGDELLGIVNVESDHEVLDEHDLHVLRLVAERLASALTLARERRRLAQRAELFGRVVSFGGTVNSSLDGKVLYDRIVAGLTGVVHADHAILTLLDRRDGTYRIQAIGGGILAYIGAEIRPGEGAAGRAIRDRAPVLDNTFGRRQFPASTAAATSPEEMATVAVPLIRDQVVVGALTLVRQDSHNRFNELELEVVQILGTQVALAITNAELHAEVMEASIRDSLTGTFNRRHFEPSLERMIASRRRLPVPERPPLAAILFDLDLFGAFNKFHGHQAGDAVLRAFGTLLRSRFRASDLVTRYGGEEFVAVLDGTGRDDAFRIAEEIRNAFAEQSFQSANGQRFSATVSAGCAELGPDDSLAELLGACDVGLAMAKGAGRNQVVAA